MAKQKRFFAQRIGGVPVVLERDGIAPGVNFVRSESYPSLRAAILAAAAMNRRDVESA